MRGRTAPLALAAAALAAAAALPTGGAAASQASFLRETGCRDIVSGDARYERDRLVDGLPVADGDFPEELKADSGRLVAVLRLASPSCGDVDYLLRAYRPDGTQLLARVVSGEAGRDDVSFDVRVPQHDRDCLAVQLSTRVGRTVVDLAPDVLESFETVCDRVSGELVYR